MENRMTGLYRREADHIAKFRGAHANAGTSDAVSAYVNLDLDLIERTMRIHADLILALKDIVDLGTHNPALTDRILVNVAKTALEKAALPKVGGLFLRHHGCAIHHQIHQGIDSNFLYWDIESKCDFDVRDLPDEYIGEDRDSVLRGCRDAHHRVIERAIYDDFCEGHTQPTSGPSTSRQD